MNCVLEEEERGETTEPGIGERGEKRNNSRPHDDDERNDGHKKRKKKKTRTRSIISSMSTHPADYGC